MDLDQYKALLADLGVDSQSPSAASLGFAEVEENQVATFRECLLHDVTASRVRSKILPCCDVRNLAKFLILAIHPSLEKHFVEDRKIRGRKVQTALRKRARDNNGQQRREDVQDLVRAGQAYDTRRMGLTANYSPLLAVREYIQFRSGAAPRPQDWGALLRAAYTATGKPTMVDGTLISLNLRRLAKRHPGLVPSGPRAVRIIEIRPSTRY